MSHVTPYTEPRRTLNEPRRTQLGNVVTYWATTHPILSHVAPYWATLHPAEQRRNLLSHYTPFTKPRRTLLSHYWAMFHPTEPRHTLTEPPT